ncbi:hypothetical protein ACQ4PT_057827 [Festuca glaucescens]
MGRKGLDYEDLNENVKKVQYAVRGELYLRASELQKEGKRIIFTNVGNPHALGQKPLTFPRQVVALCQAPFLLDDPNVGLIFPADAIARAKHYLAMAPGGLGAYSDSRVSLELGRKLRSSSRGVMGIQDGASKGVMQMLNALSEMAGMGFWSLFHNIRFILLPFPSLEVRAMVIINPGNPTGQCLSEANLREILNFCYQENLVLLADEVYQQNVYQDERPFISARKTVDEIYKVASIALSPNVPGQIFMGLMMNPPKPGDISYLKFATESKSILDSLRRRAQIMTDGFNSCRNVVCNFTEGAMYSFPQIRLPQRAMDTARSAGKEPDVFYCLKLLEATGISTVPGSGFGQKEGVFHLRTTILPAEEDMPAIMSSFKKFNDSFMEQYQDYSKL